MTDDPWAAFRSPKETTDDPWASFRAKPTDTAEEKTNKLSTTEKFAKGAISGTIGGAENIISLLDKAGIGDKDKLQIARDLASGARGIFGVTPQEYKPAGDTAWDSNKPFLERAAEAPRAMVEAGAPMALASLGGPVAAGLAVGATQAAPTIDRIRQADNTDPNAELTLGQKARVAGDLGVQMALGGLGSKLTFGASPVRAVGLEGVKGAGKQLGATALADAAIGGAGVAADKAIVENESPTLSDIGVGGIAGGAGGLFGGSKRAAKEAIVSTRFRELGNLDPQSRGEVADRLKEFGNNFGATRKTLLDDVTEASKGLDGVTKKYINDAKIKFEDGQRVNPEWIDAVTQADPEAGRALRNLDTFGVMRNYDKESFSTDAAKINPLSNWQVRWGDITAAHLLGPKAGLALAGLQGAGVAAAKGMDRLTGLSDPAKVITDKFAGSADPTQTIAEARAAAKAKAFQQNDFRRVADLDVASRNLANAKLEEQKLKLRKIADSKAAADEKQKQKDANANTTIFQKKMEAKLKLLDSLEAEDKKKAAADEQAFWDRLRDQKDMMVRSQDDETKRLLAEEAANNKWLKQQKEGLAIRERSEGASSSNAGLALRLSQLKERYRKKEEADAKKQELAIAKSVSRNNKKTETAMSRLSKTENAEALAKASKRVKEAEAKVSEAKADADENMYVFEHRGQKTRVDKGDVGNPKAYGEKFTKLTDRRLNVLDEAKSLTTSKSAHRLLDQLATDWTDSRNDPVQARNHLDRILNKKAIPAEVRKFLVRSWDRVEGTWATRKLEQNGNDSD